jgi:DNA helicase II / ATP-dependent DNA helicase PcrA
VSRGRVLCVLKWGSMKEFVLEDDFDISRAKIDYKKELNAQQLDVVLNGDGPSLVLAGAGSGKTRTITYRVAYLLEKNVLADNILLVSFTNKAAKEMLVRVESLLGHYPTGLWGGTFHSIANRMLRMYGRELGYTQNFTILDSEDSKALIKVCVKALEIDTTGRRFPSPGKLNGMISYSRNSGQSLAKVIETRYPNFIELITVIDRVAELYTQRKLQADSMDFDDLLLKLRELLHSNHSLRDKLATQFQYILVDEYQDTNVVQADIVRLLASVHENLLVVGDDAQSIYSFRAAEIKNILGFPQMYNKSKTFKLTVNYRSTPEILAVANASISQNTNQFEKELDSVRESFEKPNLVPSNNASQEAQFIAQQILQLRDKNIHLHEIAVLFRAAFHSQSLEFELMKRDIPYEYRGGLKFFERAHVKDIVSYLRLKTNPRDEVAWMRVLGLLAGVGAVTAQKIIGQIRGSESLQEVIERPVKIGKRAQGGWAMLLKTLEKLAKEELPAELIRAVTSGDYKNYIEAEYPDFSDRLEDLEQFSLFAEGYDDLRVFLDEVCLTGDYGAINKESAQVDSERIVLSTIHQAKGLEWDCVFVMHLADGKFPNGRALEEKDGIQEERRLFYVATTRARKHLFYTYPMTTGYDTLVLTQPSMFLQELPKSLFEEVRIKSYGSTYGSSGYSSSTQTFDPGWEEPTVVFDDLGETVKKEMPEGMSFLRDIDEL